MNQDSILFIGAGNMAEAMIRGILKTNLYRPENVRVTDVSAARLEYFQRELGVAGSHDNNSSAAAAPAIVLAVKPQQAAVVLEGLRDSLAHQPLFISIVTGLTTDRMREMLGAAPRIIRVVPNTPALVGSGVSAYCCSRGTTAEDKRLAESILKSVGIALEIEESLMNAVTALSGSGPAYVFYLIETLVRAGRELGLTEEAARTLTVATVGGSARLITETGLPPDELRRRVTSRRGTTQAAITYLRRKKVEQSIIAAVKAAQRRAAELSA